MLPLPAGMSALLILCGLLPLGLLAASPAVQQAQHDAVDVSGAARAFSGSFSARCQPLLVLHASVDHLLDKSRELLRSPAAGAGVCVLLSLGDALVCTCVLQGNNHLDWRMEGERWGSAGHCACAL